MCLLHKRNWHLYHFVDMLLVYGIQWLLNSALMWWHVVCDLPLLWCYAHLQWPWFLKGTQLLLWEMWKREEGGRKKGMGTLVDVSWLSTRWRRKSINDCSEKHPEWATACYVRQEVMLITVITGNTRFSQNNSVSSLHLCLVLFGCCLTSANSDM